MTWPYLQPAPDTFHSLRHDRKTVPAVHALVTDAVSVIGHRDLSIWWVHLTCHPQVRRARVLARVGDRLLSDSEQLSLGGGGKPGGGLVQRKVYPQTRRRAHRAGVVRNGSGQSPMPVNLTAEFEKRQSQLRDHPRYLGSQ